MPLTHPIPPVRLHQAALLVLLAALAGAAPARADSPAATHVAMVQFNRALAGASADADAAVAQWTALLAADPANPALRAYAGAATTLQARHALLPWRKMGLADDGLAMIDKALAQLTPAHDTQLFDGVPASLQVRFVAASTFGSLPALFNRAERGARLLEQVLGSPLLAAAPAPFKASVWLRAGQDAANAKKPDDARQWWTRAAATGTPQAADAQARLKAL